MPPGVSILVHTALIGSVAYIGMQISANSVENKPLPIAEFELPPPTDLPEIKQPSKTEQQPRSTTRSQSPRTRPDSLDALTSGLVPLEYTKPAMDPVSLAALQATNAQVAKPESAAPPTVRFAGVQTRAARKIVYVVDGSGATANSFAYLQSQLLQSIDRLSPTQLFQVVLFRSYEEHTISFAPMNKHKLARATPSNKQVVADWLADINTRGRSNPVEGLRSALSLKPDLVLLITRSIQRTEMGWAQGQQQILKELNELNPQNQRTGRRRTRIKTIQLLDEDPTGIMRAIGMTHGDGTDDYRVVTYNDLITPDSVDELATRSLGASNEQRISSASEIMSNLTQAGTSFSVFYAYADDDQRDQSLLAASQIHALIHPLAQADGRAAILDAQATLINAILKHSNSQQNNAEQQVLAIVDALSDVMYTEPNTDAQRALTLALALVWLDETEQAQAIVLELIELRNDLELNQSTLAQVVLAGVSLGLEHPDIEMMIDLPPFVTRSGSIDAVWGLIVREAITKSRLAHGHNNPWERMVELRRAARNNESIRNYIDTRISLILQSTSAPQMGAQLPDEILLGAANTMSHAIDTREQAIELYTQIAQNPSNPIQAASALWQIGVLGRAINTNDSIKQSALALTELAQRFPEHEHAGDGISGAIFATPDHEQDLLRDRLALAIKLFPDHVERDLWRLDFAQLLTDFARLDVLDPITPKTREGALAGELYEETVLGMIDRFTDPQIRRGLSLRMRLAADRFELTSADMWTKRQAMNEIMLDPQAAISTFDQLIVDTKKQGKSTDELELMRAQTLNGLGQTKSAFSALVDLSERIDATGNHTSTYWQAWALMLESIIENGSETDRIDAHRHITRLELLDANLGGSPWRERIMDARETLHSSS